MPVCKCDGVCVCGSLHSVSLSVCVSVFVAADAGKCEEQFQMVTIPLRDRDGEKERKDLSGRKSSSTDGNGEAACRKC